MAHYTLLIKLDKKQKRSILWREFRFLAEKNVPSMGLLHAVFLHCLESKDIHHLYKSSNVMLALP
jgi:hypothetical protein